MEFLEGNAHRMRNMIPSPFYVIITHQLISAGSHWIKLITWYNIVHRGYPPSDFISTEEKPRNEQMLKLNFKLVMENKKPVLQKPATEKLKSWLTFPCQETRENRQNMKEQSKCVRRRRVIK